MMATWAVNATHSSNCMMDLCSVSAFVIWKRSHVTAEQHYGAHVLHCGSTKRDRKCRWGALRAMASSKEPRVGLKDWGLWYMLSHQDTTPFLRHSFLGSRSGLWSNPADMQAHHRNVCVISRPCVADGHVVLPFLKSHTARFWLPLACTWEVNKAFSTLTVPQWLVAVWVRETENKHRAEKKEQ